MPRLAQHIQLDLPEQAIRFDVAAFDEAVNKHGIRFKHWRAMRCPAGLIDPKDIRRPHPDHAGCSNGYIYTLAGTMTCIFTGNSMGSHADDPGLILAAQAQITMPRVYDCTDCGGEVQAAPFDRLYLDEPGLTVPFWQLFESNASGVEKLNFPVVKVIDLMDANLRRYEQGVHFEVVDGKIVWRGADRPSFDAEKGRGTVCSVRYTYQPYWYIVHLPHEIRVVRTEEDFIEGTVGLARMQQLAVIQREYFFENQENDPEAPADSNRARQVKAPRDLSFGPR